MAFTNYVRPHTIFYQFSFAAHANFDVHMLLLLLNLPVFKGLQLLDAACIRYTGYIYSYDIQVC